MASFTSERNIVMNKSPSRPSHKVYAVSKSGERSYWLEIGAVWSHNDGEGFNMKLDMLPLNGAEIVIRRPKAEEGGAP